MEPNLLIWLGPTLGAMFAWGIAQGLVKKYVGEVPPARFCLYYAIANAAVSLLFWYFMGTPGVLAEENRDFLIFGLLAYILDGIAWIFYYQSIVYGPISIVGTLSAAYPALTILLARVVLKEELTNVQYVGVGGVLLGCLALAYSPADSTEKKTQKRWMGFAGAALLIWGVNGVVIKHAYTFPGAGPGNMALFIAIGGLLTLGVYGFLHGRQGATSRQEWARSFLPMAMMAVGGLLVAIAYEAGPASIVTPLSGAYPVITLTFAMMILKERPTRLHWAGIAAILLGALLTTITPSEEEAPPPPPALVAPVSP
ncbi:MAG: DMT family transporter [Deltaproteobacteria bacterium]|nr:DMT family transporter [Deltaproteobacteria bacterium]